MDEDIDEIASQPSEDPSSTSAWGLLGGASRDAADTFLAEQKRLAGEQIAWIHLQKEHLHEQRALVLSHLKWRRFEDQMEGALRIILVALGMLTVVIVGAILWNASRSEGLVIELFTVPPSFAQAGSSGEVVADALTSKLAAIRHVTVEASFSDTSDVSADHDDDVRVEIPETGISISEAWRYLRNWLGHERHVRGSLSDSGHGALTLTIDVAGAPPVSITGTNLDALETTTAEKVFSQIDPVNYVIYLGVKGRRGEGYAAAVRYAQEAPGPAQKSDAYGLWSDSTAAYLGDLALAVERARLGVEVDPSIAVTHLELADHLQELGRSEEALAEYRAISRLDARDQAPIRQEYAFAQIRADAARDAANAVGDYSSEAAVTCLKFCSAADSLMLKSIVHVQLHDWHDASRLAELAQAAGDVQPVDMADVRYLIAADGRDWKSAQTEMDALIRAFANRGAFASQKYNTAVISTLHAPSRAIVFAHLGRFAEAHREVDATPADCYDCDRARGTVDALENKAMAASFWYARAAAEAPSLPFAYADWGATLLRKGDFAGAVAKFRAANGKGPHFADALEMWGEALIAENRSDLALAKFAEANQYAPRWGRLHLKWGEALIYVGRPGEAARQFTMAAGLDLTAAERSEYVRTGAGHG